MSLGNGAGVRLCIRKHIWHSALAINVFGCHRPWGHSALPSEKLLLSCQAEQDGLGGVFKQGCPVLGLPLLHPVTIDPESTGIDQFADRLQTIGITLHHICCDGLHIAVVEVDPDRCQDS